VGNDRALGSGTLTLSGGTIEPTVTGESITLANCFQVDRDSQVVGPAFLDIAPRLTFTGAGTLSAILTVSSFSTSPFFLTFSGSLGGDGALTVDTFAWVTLSGMDANAFTGTTTVNGPALLFLNKPAGVTAIAGHLDIGDGAIVQLDADNQLDPMATVTISNYGILKQGNYNLSAGSMIMPTGPGAPQNVITGDTPTLTVGFNNQPATFAGVISGPGTVVKVGTGT
jgi:hypothetical protein